MQFSGPSSYDAVVAIALAVHNLTSSGRTASELGGDELLAQLQRTQFEGVSGPVAFDENGDRVRGQFNVFNLRDGDASFAQVGAWIPASDASADAVVRLDADMRWPGNMTGAPPVSGACPKGSTSP